jgi:hypothetical protein
LSVIDNSQIERLTDVLEYDFFKNNLNINFEEIDLTGNYTSIRDRITIKLNERINTFNKSGNENF